MSEPRIWKERAVCPCGATYDAPFGKLFHVGRTVCIDCGTPKDEFTIKTRRWVDTGRLLKPSTWDTGHWEDRP